MILPQAIHVTLLAIYYVWDSYPYYYLPSTFPKGRTFTESRTLHFHLQTRNSVFVRGSGFPLSRLKAYTNKNRHDRVLFVCYMYFASVIEA